MLNFYHAAVLHFQLKEVPDDFFVDIVSRNNFLTTTLQARTSASHMHKATMLYISSWQVFFSSLEQNGSLDSGLVKKGLQFRENLTKRYNWDFSSEPDEYAPTIVSTDWWHN